MKSIFVLKRILKGNQTLWAYQRSLFEYRFWRLRLIHFLAGGRAVLMNMGVKGIIFADADQETLIANAFVEDLQEELAHLYQDVLDMSQSVAELKRAHKASEESVVAQAKSDLVCHIPNVHLPKSVCAYCKGRRGLRSIQEREFSEGGGTMRLPWSSPRYACTKCRRTGLRGKYRFVKESHG